MFKIFVVCSFNPYCHSSASANRILTLLEGLNSLGCNVNLLIYEGYTSTEEKSKFGVQGVYENICYEYVFPVLLEGYWKVRFYKYIGRVLRNSKLLKELKKRVKNEKGIVWTVPSYLSFQFAVLLHKQVPQIKLFTEMSEFLDIHHYNKGNFLQRLQEDYKKNFFERNAFYAYDGIALMTKTLMTHYESFQSPRPMLLHLPMTVDLERFNTRPSHLPEFKKPYIVFVGVMNDAKDGVSILIKSFQKIMNKYPLYNLYLVGPWNYDTPKHLALINEFQLTQKVFWMKEYPRNKIPAIICNAELLVLSRPDSKQAQGGFPTKLGEYLATGNPICATSVGEIPDYLTDNESVFFAKPGCIESFSNAMDRALENLDFAKKVGLNGRLIAKREFNKEIQSQFLFEFLSQLL